MVDRADKCLVFISIPTCADREPGGYWFISCDYSDFTSDRSYHFCKVGMRWFLNKWGQELKKYGIFLTLSLV